jgi:hypothetical protein
MYLIGWKSIANYIGVTVKTVKDWYYKRAPFHKMKSYPSKQGRVVTTPQTIDEWLKGLGFPPRDQSK